MSVWSGDCGRWTGRVCASAIGTGVAELSPAMTRGVRCRTGTPARSSQPGPYAAVAAAARSAAKVSASRYRDSSCRARLRMTTPAIGAGTPEIGRGSVNMCWRIMLIAPRVLSNGSRPDSSSYSTVPVA